MIFGVSVRVAHNALEDQRHLDRSNFEARFLPNFAGDGILQPLSRLDGAAGQRPLASQRLAPPLYQQNFILLKNQRADAENWAGRIAAAVAGGQASILGDRNAKAGSIRHIRVDLTPEARSGLKSVHIRLRTGYRAGPPPSANRVTAN